MPAPKRNIKPRIPGEKVEEQFYDDEPVTVEDEDLQDSTEESQDNDEEITVKKSDLESMVAAMVEKQVEERVVSEVKAARRRSELANKNLSDQNLPDQKDIDPLKIKRAVLTKQGWVCPIVHPTDALRMSKLHNIPE